MFSCSMLAVKAYVIRLTEGNDMTYMVLLYKLSIISILKSTYVAAFRGFIIFSTFILRRLSSPKYSLMLVIFKH